MHDAVGSPEINSALEAGYNLRVRHPERDAFYAEMADRSAALASLRPPTRLRYAAHERATVDVFLPSKRGSAGRLPLLVFIHGGYWRALSAALFHCVGQAYLDAGVAVAFPGYPLAPDVSVAAIGRHMDLALTCLAEHADTLGLDRTGVVISGHSAGGMLAARACEQRRSQTGLSFAACVPLSGIFQLEPLLQTSINRDIRLSVEDARAESPALAAEFPALVYRIAVGGAETDAFRHQSFDFAAYLERLGLDSQCLEVPGRTHFTILDSFSSPAELLFRETLGLVMSTSHS